LSLNDGGDHLSNFSDRERTAASRPVSIFSRIASTVDRTAASAAFTAPASIPRFKWRAIAVSQEIVSKQTVARAKGPEFVAELYRHAKALTFCRSVASSPRRCTAVRERPCAARFPSPCDGGTASVTKTGEDGTPRAWLAIASVCQGRQRASQVRWRS